MSKHVVCHPKLFMRVNGATKHLEKGSVLDSLGAEQVSRLGKKIKPFQAAETVDMKVDNSKGRK